MTRLMSLTDASVRPSTDQILDGEATVTGVLRPDVHAGKVAVVSGGGTGLGRATALDLAAGGAQLVICGRRPEPLEAVRDEIARAGGQCLVKVADIRED